MLKKVLSMKNNHFGFMNEHGSSNRGRELDHRDPAIPNDSTLDFKKTYGKHIKASITI